MAPSYGQIIRKFALDVWYGRKNKTQFIDSVFRFRKRYEDELVKHYRKLKYPFRPGQIRDQADEWLKDQIALTDKIQEIAAEKKDNLAEEFEKLRSEKRIEVAGLLTDARRLVLKPEGRVSPVISFSRNLEDKAIQMGEDAAFDLGTEINHAIVHGMGDVYRWTSQEDDRVRKTHRILNGKLFTYKSPPTTIDEYKHTHTGNPGSDWGCRCWETPAQGKPLLNYTAKA